MTVRMGVDIGGTGIKGAPVDLSTGALAAPRSRVDTPKGARPDDVVPVVSQVVGTFDTTGAVGITFPGVVVRGTIGTAANVSKSWLGVDGHDRFGAALDRPVLLMNDADAAGVAEMRFGAGRDQQRGVVVMVTLGTGIGSAVFNDGVLVPNTELGHLELDGQDAEKLAAGSARDRLGLSWRAWAKRVQRYLVHLDGLLWPDLVIVGGGMSKESARWLPAVSVRCPVVPAALLNNAGIVGAALLAEEQAVTRAQPGATQTQPSASQES